MLGGTKKFSSIQAAKQNIISQAQNSLKKIQYDKRFVSINNLFQFVINFAIWAHNHKINLHIKYFALLSLLTLIFYMLKIQIKIQQKTIDQSIKNQKQKKQKQFQSDLSLNNLLKWIKQNNINQKESSLILLQSKKLTSMLPYYPWIFMHPLYYNNQMFNTKSEDLIKKQDETINNLKIADQFQENRKDKIIPLLSREDLVKLSPQCTKKLWTEEEDNKLRQYVSNGNFSWEQISKLIPGRNQNMCYSRYRRLGLQRKFHWKQEDDQEILRLVGVYGENWITISKHFLKRSAKQIREHYFHFLRPNISKSQWSIDEDLKLLELIQQHGKKWKKFESILNGRTQNQIKNRFYGQLNSLIKKKKRLSKLKIQ